MNSWNSCFINRTINENLCCLQTPTMIKQWDIFREVTHLGGRPYHGNTGFNGLCLKQRQNYMLRWCKENQNLICRTARHESEKIHLLSDPKTAKSSQKVCRSLINYAVTPGIADWHKLLSNTSKQGYKPPKPFRAGQSSHRAATRLGASGARAQLPPSHPATQRRQTPPASSRLHRPRLPGTAMNKPCCSLTANRPLLLSSENARLIGERCEGRRAKPPRHGRGAGRRGGAGANSRGPPTCLPPRGAAAS